MLRTLYYNLLFLTLFAVLLLGVLEVVLRVQKTFTTQSVSAVGIPIFQPDEIHTYAHKPGSRAQNGYGDPTPTININDRGFRNTDDFLPDENQTDLLVLGDSFTFGTGVEQEATFSALLADEKTRVWNAGVIGYSVNHYRAQLQELLPIIEPDLVIINIFVANDITELRRKKDVFQGDKLVRIEDQKVFANQNHQLESQEAQIPSSYALHWLGQKADILAYKNGWKDPRSEAPTLTWPVFLDEDHPAWDPHLPDYWDRFNQHLEGIKALETEYQIPILISLIPMDVQVDPAYQSKYARIYFDPESRQADRPQTRILQTCVDLDLDCVDPLSSFRDHPQKKQLYFAHNADPHFDLLGHKIYATFLKNHLSQILQP